MNCENCQAKSNFLCGCKKASYCSPDCQLIQRPNHKQTCDFVRKFNTFPGYNDTFNLTDEMIKSIKLLYSKSSDAICVYSQYEVRPKKFRGKLFKHDGIYYHFFLMPFKDFKQTGVMKQVLNVMENLELTKLFAYIYPIFKLTLKVSVVDKVSFCLLIK
jgi:hypothetical protein